MPIVDLSGLDKLQQALLSTNQLLEQVLAELRRTNESALAEILAELRRGIPPVD